MKYKRYERDKDSGVEWIGEIPEEWDTRKIKYLANLRNTKAIDVDNNKRYIGLEDIESKTGKVLSSSDDDQTVGETANLFEKNDVLFAKLRPYLAKCIIADFAGRCTSELLILKSNNDVLPNYLYYFMLSEVFID